MAKIEKGTKFSAQEEVDKYRAIYYAGASGDFNPIHIDPEFGQMVGLGGVILHGLCALGFVAKTVTDWTGDPGKAQETQVPFCRARQDRGYDYRQRRGCRSYRRQGGGGPHRGKPGRRGSGKERVGRGGSVTNTPRCPPPSSGGGISGTAFITTITSII